MSTSVPAGWYPDPQNGAQLRYWDGTSWTEHRAPATGQPLDQTQAQPPIPPYGGVATGPPAKPEMSYAWALACTPALWLLLDVLAFRFEGDMGAPVVGAASLGATIALTILDSKALAKAGVRVSAWWGVLLLPVYLILRTKRARTTAAIPILWFALMIGYVVASYSMTDLFPDSDFSSSSATPGDWSDPIASYTCQDLAADAVGISEEGEGVTLLKVRSPQAVEDNTTTYSLPTGTDETLVLACEGTGVWSDGDTSTEVRLELTVDADGDSWVSYEPTW